MKISLVTPAGKASRAGNRTTATRWAGLLRELGHQVAVTTAYVDSEADLLIALHAWRSAGSILRFRDRHPRHPVVVALTGTDIYRDITADPETTLASLDRADGLIGLHDLVSEAIPHRYRDKLRVVFQSAHPRIGQISERADGFEVLVAGHLREEKDPFRAAAASRLLPVTSRIEIVHLGGAHSEVWAERARSESAGNARYRWLGDVPGSMVRRWMVRARLMVLSSHQEGGANVISEAVVASLPVIASAIPGSIGLLGADYPGYYPGGDTAALAAILLRAEQEPSFLKQLGDACAARAPLFRPSTERAGLAGALDAAILHAAMRTGAETSSRLR